MKEIIKLPPFKRFCMTIGNLPSSYVESLTYAELLYWFCDYLQNKVIPTIDNNAQAVQELQGLFTELQNYVNNYFENLDVQEEINNKLDEMVESGTLAELLNSQVLTLLEDVTENINVINEKVENLKPFEFCKALNIIKSRTTEELYTLEEIQEKITAWKNANIKKVCITVEIQPSASDQTAFENGTKTFNEIDIRMFPSTDVLKSYIDLCKENDIDVYDLKFHLTWLHQKCGSVNISTKASRYINVVNETMPTIEHEFEYISVFNEWAEMLQYSGVEDFLIALKNYSKVLLSGIFEENITDELLEIVDGYCPHFYIKSSRLGSDTTLEFLINMFEQSYQYQSLKKWQERSNKPIIVGECGCMSYWNALAFPMQWEHSGQIVENGAPQVLYIKALLHIFKKWNVTNCNYWWDIYGNAYDIIKEWEAGNHE